MIVFKKLKNTTTSAIYILLFILFIGCGSTDDIVENKPPTNIPPTAVAGVDQVVNQGDLVLLNGSFSFDPDGQLKIYHWEQVDGVAVSINGADTALADFIAPVADDRVFLVFRLTVEDDAGAQSSDQVTIAVNCPPTADAGPDLFTYGLNVVQMQGVFEDADGTIESQLWERVDNGGLDIVLLGGNTDSPIFIAPDSSTELTFRYTVTDNDGAQHSDYVSVYVSRVIFADSFDDNSSLINWGFGNDTTLTPQWNILDGELYQSVNLRNRNSFLESYLLGTFAHLNASILNSAAFRFSVDITSEGADVGIMFPYVNSENYFRFTMNSSYGYARFEKREGQNFSTLALNSRGYVDGQTITVSVEIKEDTIVVFVDNEPLFSYQSNLPIAVGSVALYCQGQARFDNVIISENSPQPIVAISTPLAYTIALTSGNEGEPLAVEAVVLNQPIGSSVVFTLNGGPEQSATEFGMSHRAWFFNVPVGDHKIEALLRDAEGRELGRDINAAVGVGGRYIIAAGDSITNGVGDEDPTNNSSADGRIVSRQGFAAELNDFLTSHFGRPHVVFNEGIPGENSSRTNTERIDSILKRHPKADTMILLIGTNDSNSSGSGPTSPSNFANNVRSIADKALNVVDQVWIAQIPPLYNPSGELKTPENDSIILYNDRIPAIVASNNRIFLGPDFYGLFLSEYFADGSGLYDPDGTHPNDAGYQAMADAWYSIIVSSP